MRIKAQLYHKLRIPNNFDLVISDQADISHKREPSSPQDIYSH
jgi:hypothetical protein